MRIIKLSPEDPDMLNREKVNDYFNRKLRARNPQGQFLLKKGWISKKGKKGSVRESLKNFPTGQNNLFFTLR